MGDIFTAIEDERIETWLAEIESSQDEEMQLKILFHIELLADADFIRGVKVTRSSGHILAYGFDGPRITMKGYDFADIVKDKKLLNKTIAAIKKAGYMAGFETLKTYAPKVLHDLVAGG